MDETGRRRRREGPARDYTTIGEVADPAFARPPDAATVFAIRASRLAALAAEDRPLGPYLDFLARLVAVQHEAQTALPLPAMPDPAWLDRQSAHQMPPLTRAVLAADGGFPATLDWFLAHAALVDVPAEAESARARLQARPWPERLELAEAILDGAYRAEQMAESLYASAALQVHLTRLAAQLDGARLHAVGEGVCPACGTPPVASLIVGWAKADRARYCCCALCSTMWNAIRIRCTACGSTEGIAYFLVEEQSKDVAVETCGMCRSYVKHLHQHRRAELEPFADDIASLALDLLVREQDFRRVAGNALMIMA